MTSRLVKVDCTETMSDIAIRAEGLSKKYRLGELWREDKLRNVLGKYVRAPWKLLKPEK